MITEEKPQVHVVNKTTIELLSEFLLIVDSSLPIHMLALQAKEPYFGYLLD